MKHFWTREDRIAEKICGMLYVRGIKFGKYRKNMIRRIAATIRHAENEEPRVRHETRAV